MDFYYGVVSGNSARTAFALHEARVPFVPHALQVPQGESRTPEYLALNPMGKVPAIIDGDLELWESNAINWYVAETYPEAKLLPASPAARARVQRWMFFQAAHVTPACFSIFRATNVRVQKFWGFRGDPESLQAGQKELVRYLAVLEQALAHREWLEGDFSLADIAYAPHLWLVGEGGFDFSQTPAVSAWLERLLARPGWKQTLALIYGE